MELQKIVCISTQSTAIPIQSGKSPWLQKNLYMGRLLGNVKVLSACGTKDVRLLILSECYYEEPYAGKPHVRICEGLKLQGFSLLDCIRE